MLDLWGEEVQPQPKKRQPGTPKHPVISLTATDCLLYGHSFIPSGMLNEKVCTVCEAHAYCPGCTPIAPSNAQPFFCTRHSEGKVQA